MGSTERYAIATIPESKNCPNMSHNLVETCLTADDESFNIEQEAEVFVFPASFAQQRLWFLHQLVPGNAFYNVGCAIHLTGSLNLTALEQAFNTIVRRHESLRTTFVMVEGEPMQVIAPALSISLPAIDLGKLSATERETEVRRLAIQEAKRTFDLGKGPLLRLTLLQLSETEHVLLLNLHHIVADGWSIGVLIRELGTLYTAFVSLDAKFPVSTSLPELPIQYADFAEWQRQLLQDEVLETQLAYWRQQLNNLSVLNLPTDRLRPAIQTFQGAKQFLQLPLSLSKMLEALSQREGVTLFITLLAAFQTLLYRYTGQEDIAVGSPIANRNRSEVEGLIGFFVNSLVLRTYLGGNPTFIELLERVKQVALGAYAHQDLPFEKLVEELHPERDLSRNPLFQVSFTLQNTPVEVLKLPELKLKLLDFDPGTAKLDLEFHLWQDKEGIRGEVVYSTDLFDDITINRMLEHFTTLLSGIVANPEQRLGELPILTKAEDHQLLIELTPNKSSLKQENIKIEPYFHHLFEAQVEQTPNAIAVVFEDQPLTYDELNIWANQLAHYLQKLGVIPDAIVGICIERSVEMIVGLLGILKAGGAYLPLDPAYPQERLNLMLEEAKVAVLLTQQQFVERFAPQELSIVCLDNEKEANVYAQHSKENPTSSVIADNLAYIIYTSGSTGKPKGVQIEHRGLYNLAEAQIDTFNLQPSDRVLQFASLSFDASIFEIVMALGTGATLYLAKKEFLLPGQALIQLLRDRAITHVTLPPAVLAVLPKEELPALQTIIAAGEFCSQDIVKHWAVGRRFFNAYGPTEATVWSTVAEISDRSSKPPIGRAIANTQVYILDEYLQPVPIGIRGELYIGGEGLARGYLNRPDLTAEKFIPHPFSEKQGARLYKTGDLARYRSDGNIEFLGRIDEQVKIRGFRIELGEIEAVLSQHPSIKETVVIAREKVSGDKRLVAYIVPNPHLTFTIIQLRDFLKKKLPDYMVPSAFVVLDFLPLTPNGKIDRRAIPDEPTNQSIDQACVEPRTPIESTLAEIWAEVLNLERVGINDNFFDLGGDSLLAIRLIDRIHKQFERELPLSALFLTPTVAGLARILSPGADSLPWSPLVAIQPHGSNPPFFCVHPIFGVVFPYYELAYHLGTDQPFYGLQPKGLDGESPPLTRIEDMAAHYIEALRVVQPKGPYFLGGWSFGGLVAFEMAQQLQRAGHQVALLALLDTQAPVSANQPSFGDGLKFLLSTVRRDIWPFLVDYFYLAIAPKQHQSDTRSSHTLHERLQNILQQLRTNLSWNSIVGQAVIANLMPQETRLRMLNELTISSMLRVFHAHSQATLSYVPQVYKNRITLFTTSEQSGKAHQHPSWGWSELAGGGLEVHRVPGNHLSMLKHPHIQVLSEQLKACLQK
ncbi:MAG: amino acid adenylation domain-containing protein [Aphanothece sp. CMT-3BRIN-NPC111]|jgi:amino acid adenylation domain-containing protein|nr:amino acid adenylation domain-containing protein [Aphanothece sp. CMT-3BRIN-NPC111]